MGIPKTLRTVAVGIPVGFLFFTQIGYVARVEGVSMQPALNPDVEHEDYVFLSHWSVRKKNVERGDIVTFKSPKFPNQKLIKRIIGLSGDVIHTIGYKKEIVEVPEEQCWVEGDHTGHSMDSNTFGSIPVEIITAKATCIVWPPSRWQSLDSNIPSNRIPLNHISFAPLAV